MSIFDDTPLPDGTDFCGNKVVRYCPDTRKYLVSNTYSEKWLSRDNVENRHADYLLNSMGFRHSVQPTNSYNTRFTRTNPN